jgi:S-(hydroxymethyl)glutathione dehydrogenase/alcohol dehydrogenase
VKTKAAIMRQAPGKWEIAELDLDGPQQDELLIEVAASGLCHSDDHIATGDLGMSMLPVAAGHEGAGVVVEVGPNTPGWSVGDHVVMAFLPACGRCKWCAQGMQNLCDNGAGTLSGARPDGTYRLTENGKPIGQMSGIATFSQWTTISTRSAVKVPEDLPLDVICLIGCGVPTGWGSAVNSAQVRPGHTVIVMGIGGIGINAVQGAAHAGATTIIACDPVELKREFALEMGATHAVTNMEEATELARSFTNGQGADSCIVTVGVTTGEHIAEGVEAIRKGGTVVATGIGSLEKKGIPISPTHLTLFQKRIQGSLCGESNQLQDILLMTQLYQQGRLRLDELITTRYKLEDINQGYADMHAGKNIRGVVIHEH